MRFGNLQDWLRWMESRHPRSIELGLDRVQAVYDRLNLDFSAIPVITVAGTNGKGSCVAMISAMLTAAGYRVGQYTSPHILCYNERVVIAGETAADDALCRAFAEIDAAMGETSLTYFEFGTLAALVLFRDAAVDALVLEVGLGGRLDAVNIVEPDIAVVTSIALDHQDWLGNNLDSIAAEKAGIFRPGIAVICGEASPPASLLSRAEALQCRLLLGERDFAASADEADGWNWRGLDAQSQPLRLHFDRMPGLALCNAAIALQVAAVAGLALSSRKLRDALLDINLPARCQRLVTAEGVEVILDVAHNPAAVSHLAAYLRSLPRANRTAALFGVMADKDVDGMVDAIKAEVDAWFVGDLKDNPRALSARDLAARIHEREVFMISVSKNLRQAWRRVLSLLEPGDRLVGFGSFFTVAEITAIMDRDRQRDKESSA